jgi:hypothetical protein
MIEYFTALSLLFLVIGHGLLIKKCTKLTEDLEPSAQSLSTELKDITSILDDIADLFNSSLEYIGNSPIAQTPSSPMESILSTVLSGIMTPKPHGPTQEPQVGEIYEVHPPPKQTEDESN